MGAQNLRESRASADALLRVFGVRPDPTLREVAKAALTKKVRVYHFDRESSRVHDISQLAPSAQSKFEASWGGLSEFSERANAEVAAAVANANGRS